ncbi:unnamed protein product [Adineta steineri]|uniref:G-protein coupled receptors family 1 profile domain-containing protein n=1 Tax=Adineta steineri TaxID=433720 RepID=A0A813SPB4_9BILA|nr:unnamed protein product [Adineta steineri]CAF1281739.1 unnamed protein product [Adineta steineri]
MAMFQNRHRRVILETPSFCAWWNWWAYSSTTALVWIAAYGSIERHLLIFHNGIMATRKRRFFLHILPMLTAIVCSYTFYFVVIVFHSCDDYWDYTALLCLLPCYIYSESTVALYDFVMHTMMPLSIVTVANVALVIRVLWQKRNQHGDWQRKWKLAAHLILIAIFFMITWYPLAINNMLIDYPFVMIYYRYRRVIPATPSFCLWWNWWVYSLTAAFIWVAAWGSIDRHLLIFHNGVMATRRRRFVFHTLPMLIATIYPYIFYFIVIILNSCENYWDYNYVFCLQPCFGYSQPTVALYDFVMHTMIPLSIVTVANVALVIRVLWQKRNQQRDWQRKWKLAAHLILIAIYFMITWYPEAINNIVYIYTSSPVSVSLQVKYFFFLPAILEMTLPMVSLFFLPDFKRTVFRFRQTTVRPVTFNLQTMTARRL